MKIGAIMLFILFVLCCVFSCYVMVGIQYIHPVVVEAPPKSPQPTSIELINFSEGVKSMTITSAVLVAVAGAVLSLILSYVPGLNTKYAALPEEYKKLVMLGLLVLVSGFIFLSSCLNWWVWVECSKQGVLSFVEVFVLAIMGNQSAFGLSPQTKAVKEAKRLSKL